MLLTNHGDTNQTQVRESGEQLRRALVFLKLKNRVVLTSEQLCVRLRETLCVESAERSQTYGATLKASIE